MKELKGLRGLKNIYIFTAFENIEYLFALPQNSCLYFQPINENHDEQLLNAQHITMGKQTYSNGQNHPGNQSYHADHPRRYHG